MPRGTKVITVGQRATYFTCFCGYEIPSETGLRLHKRVAHGTDPKDPIGDGNPFKCWICKKVFDTDPQLLTHMRHAGHC